MGNHENGFTTEFTGNTERIHNGQRITAGVIRSNSLTHVLPRRPQCAPWLKRFVLKWSLKLGVVMERNTEEVYHETHETTRKKHESANYCAQRNNSLTCLIFVLLAPRLRRINRSWLKPFCSTILQRLGVVGEKSMPVSPKLASKAVLAKPPYHGLCTGMSKLFRMQICPQINAD